MTAADRWRSAGSVDVTLPSGFRVRGAIPPADEIIRRGVAPRAARAAALAVEAGGSDAGGADADQDATAKFLDTLRMLAARFVRAVWDDEDETWEPIILTAEDFDRDEFDRRDVEALIQIVSYQRSPDQITAASLGRPLEEAGPAEAWAGFRDDAGGDGDSQDGGAVRPSAVEGPADD